MSLFVFLIIGAGIGVLGMPNTEVSIRKNSLVRSSVDDSITKTREEVKTSEIAKVKNFKSSHVISYMGRWSKENFKYYFADFVRKLRNPPYLQKCQFFFWKVDN